MISLRKSLVAAFALSLLSFGTAFAQDAPAAPGGAPVKPTDTKQFGDWMVRCYPVNSPSPCDMFELLANKQSGQRILSISIAYVPSNDRHVIQIAVPLGVSIPKGLFLSADSYSSNQLHYRRCDRGGCYIEMLMPNEAVSQLGSSTGGGKIRVFIEAKAIDIPFSLNGFSDAHGTMVDLARKKTGKGGEAAAPAAPTDSAPAPTAPAPSAPAPTTPDNDPSRVP
ncbi:MAG: invasion associated locus B family protein [Rhizomicrobium sp.]